MSQPSITDAVKINGTSAQADALVTALTSVATAITAAGDAGKFGGPNNEEVTTAVEQSLQDQLIDFAEVLGASLSP